jgi:hypothetical protein
MLRWSWIALEGGARDGQLGCWLGVSATYFGWLIDSCLLVNPL